MATPSCRRVRWVILLACIVAALPLARAQSPELEAADGAALERALQQADGPRRRILQAARGRPAVPPAAAVAPAALAAPAAALRTRSEREPALLVLDAAPPVAPLTLLVPIAAVPPLARPEALPPLAPLAELRRAALPRLELVTLVEPRVPERLLSRPLEISIELTVQMNGSVDAVSITGQLPSQIAQPVLQAVRQWRYAPQPEPRPHRVTLVLKPA